MSEVEGLLITDSGWFVAGLITATWLIALAGTIYEFIKWKCK